MNKPVFCLALALVSTPGLSAEPTTAALDRLVDCATVKDSRARLACFDQEIAPLARARTAASVSLPGSSSAATNRPAPIAAPQTTAPAPSGPVSFGSEQLAPKLRPAESEEEQALHAHIAELRTAGSGKFVVTLDNGQVWSHDNVMLGEYLRKGEAITISKGALGSYRLTRDAGAAKNWIRVTRIR